MRKTVRVCQNVTCHQQGSEKVLVAFQACTLPEVDVESSGCLGQCGSGPMVLILPEETWYCHLHSRDVPVIAEKHLRQGKVVTEKLYPKFHPSKPIGIWIVTSILFIGTLSMFYWVITSQLF